MSARRWVWLALAALGATIVAGVVAAAWWLGGVLAPQHMVAAIAMLGIAALVALLGLAAFGIVLELRLLRPLLAVTQSMRIIQRAHPGHELELSEPHWLGELPAALLDLGDELRKARREISQALARGAAQAEAEKSRLETVLLELTEGVVVCDPQGRILLYNPAALKVLAREGAVGLGRSLYELCARAPIEHALDHLRDSEAAAFGGERDATFIGSTAGRGLLIRCRLRLVDLDTHTQSGFVLAFDDVTRQLEALRQRDSMLRRIVVQLREPLAGMRTAAARLLSGEPIDAQARSDYERTVNESGAALDQHLALLDRDSRALTGRDWLMGDVYSTDLVRLVGNRLTADSGVRATLTGVPHWIAADSHALVIAISHLLQRLHETTGAGEFDIETSLEEDRVYIDLVWPGTAIAQAALDAWSADPLPDAIGAQSVGEIVEAHGGVLTSRAYRRDGYAVVRLPVPVSSRQFEEHQAPLPPRPEFYDFEQSTRLPSEDEFAERALSELDFVVFDTETTGLRPSQGDEIISIGGVRVVNGRILGGETFEALVNPGRPIPRASIRFHHITDEMVAGEPALEKVLPQFRQFVGDAVLVAHNSAFDMKFIHLRQTQAGVTFDNPVLDTLLISVFLHRDAQDHTLDGIARRLGVEIAARHTALGDALVTAEVLLQLLGLADERGIRTLGALQEASARMVQIRKLQKQF